jgi:hypothetical protein
MSPWPAVALFIAVGVWSELPAQVQDEGAHYFPPVALLAEYEFTAGEDFKPLLAVSGTWVGSGGTFNSTSATTAIATIPSYEPRTAFEDDLKEISTGQFWFRARMLNQRSGSSTRVGIVYQYQDPDNFYEVSFSPGGSVFVRDVSNGVARTVATGTYSGGGQNKWFDVRIEWTATETIVWVNGLPVVRGIKQDGRTHGRVGVITRQTTAKFDRLLVTRAWGDQPFRESFSAGVPSWSVIRGNWSVVNGVYQNSAVQLGSITLLPIVVGIDNSSQTTAFTVRARMLNPYGGSGNRMGFVYKYPLPNVGGNHYGEIVFGADGIARVNDVETFGNPDGTQGVAVTESARAPYPGGRNQWFDVEFSGEALISPMENHDVINVSVNGTPVFTDLEVGQVWEGSIGLVTNWTPGRFDDVWFNHGGPPRLVTETFANDRSWAAHRGTWDVQGGVLNDRTVAERDIAYMKFLGAETDYNLRARMLNPYSGPGNRIGLIFSFDSLSGDYYEVVFAPTGQAYLNKFIQGQLTQVAAGTHTALGSNVWFNVELIRRGPHSTVKVNNRIVFENVPTAQLDGIGSGPRFGPEGIRSGLGLISHWAPARFDDLQLQDFLDR